MIFLLLSCLCSTFLLVLFRYFPKYGVDTRVAIVVNYFTATICGMTITYLQGDFTWNVPQSLYWLIPINGVLFISLFYLMGVSSQQNGMGATSVAVKMSMGLSILFFTIYYSEAITPVKVLGISLTFASILLISKTKEETKSKAPLLLFILFIGSALLDCLLNLSQNNTGTFPMAMLTALGFLSAGCIGIFVITGLVVSKKIVIKWKSIVAGIILGIPNYFSIYLLLNAYSTTNWENTNVLALASIGTVIFSAFGGMIIFKESTDMKRWIGLLLALISIVLLTYKHV